MEAKKELVCTCGDTYSQHVDGCEQCVVPGCGCKEFEGPCETCGGTGELDTPAEQRGGDIVGPDSRPCPDCTSSPDDEPDLD